MIDGKSNGTRARLGASSRDVAKLAGVSQSTVSRALRGDPRISAETRAVVAAAARQLDYPARGTSAHVAVSRPTVAVVVSDVTNPFYPELLDVLQTELGFLGFQALLFNQRTSTIITPTLLEQITQHDVVGLILTSVGASWSLPETINSGAVPAVLLNRLVDQGHIDSVSANNVEGGRMAARYLIELGHRRLGLVAGPRGISTHRDRREGFLEVTNQTDGVTVHEAPADENSYSHETGRLGTETVLREAPDVTAVFCTNDLMAFGSLSAAKATGRSVPEDLSVLGFDNIEMAGWAALDLSTVHHPFREMAKHASQRLAQLIGSPDAGPPRHIELPVRIVPRSSTRRLSPGGSR
jgi:LacI family transcriptional regulator